MYEKYLTHNGHQEIVYICIFLASTYAHFSFKRNKNSVLAKPLRVLCKNVIILSLLAFSIPYPTVKKTMRTGTYRAGKLRQEVLYRS